MRVLCQTSFVANELQPEAEMLDADKIFSLYGTESCDIASNLECMMPNDFVLPVSAFVRPKTEVEATSSILSISNEAVKSFVMEVRGSSEEAVLMQAVVTTILTSRMRNATVVPTLAQSEKYRNTENIRRVDSIVVLMFRSSQEHMFRSRRSRLKTNEVSSEAR